jgi:hypothetical protein
MPVSVIQGATLRCTCGSVPACLKVTSQAQMKVGSQLAATIADTRPFENIVPFGICSQLTAASGVPTACALALCGAWSPGSVSRMEIANQSALISTDRLTCSVGGVITVASPGQGQMQST